MARYFLVAVRFARLPYGIGSLGTEVSVDGCKSEAAVAGWVSACPCSLGLA